jgi:hypothetical protein
VLSDADAVATLAELRTRSEHVKAELERSRFGQRAATRLIAERDRLIAMAADFGGAAQRLGGQALRELLVPWLAAAEVDKQARTVTLWIRQVPAMGTLSSVVTSGGARLTTGETRLVVVRTIQLPPLQKDRRVG